MIKGWLTENLLLKLIALLLTLVLHLVVNADEVETGIFFVDLSYTLPPNMVLLEQPVPKLNVSISGKRSALERLRSAPMEPIIIDLDESSDENYQFGPDLLKLPAGLRVTAVDPPSIRVPMDVRRKGTVRVVPRIEGQPATGYRIVSSKIIPEQVEVRGPSTVLGDVVALAEPLSLNERRRTIEATVALRNAGKGAGDVEFIPTKVQIVVEIAPVEIERTIDELPLAIRELSMLSSVEPKRVSVTLLGPPEQLQELDPDNIAPYLDASEDDSRPPGTRLKEVMVDNLPPDVRVKSITPPQVQLTTMAPPLPEEDKPDGPAPE